jgi:hypothetical protein
LGREKVLFIDQIYITAWRPVYKMTAEKQEFEVVDDDRV